MARVGKLVGSHQDYVRLLSYVVLFSPDFLEVKDASVCTADAMSRATDTAIVAVSAPSSPAEAALEELRRRQRLAESEDPRKKVEEVQEMLVTMLRRFVFSQFPRRAAVTVFAELLACIADLRELTAIKRRRALARPVTQPGSQAEEEEEQQQQQRRRQAAN